MDLISIILTLAIIGVVVWLILQLPMPEIFKQGIRVLAILYALLYLISKLPIPKLFN